MTDKTDTGERAVGNVVAGEATRRERGMLEGIRTAIDGIGTSGAVEVATGIRAAIEEAEANVERFALDIAEALDGVGGTETAWRYADLIADADADSSAVEMVSRDELLTLLHETGNVVAERTLRSWEASGMLPRPQRRWHEAGPRSGVRAMYPWWAAFAVSMAKLLRERGYSPDDTRSEIVRVLPHMAEGYYKGARDIAIAHRLTPVLIDGLASLPWPKDRAPSVVEIRILDQAGGELHAQRLAIAEIDGATNDEIT